MIAVPFNSSNIASIIGIDPGTDTCGVAVIKFDLTTMELVGVDAQTLVGSRMNRDYGWIGDIHGDRASRIWFLQNRLEEIFNFVQPMDIVCESPFFSRRRPQAFGALTEIVTAIRFAVMRHDGWKQLIEIDPPSVKIAVGAEVQGGKESVRQALLAILPTLNWQGNVPFESLDEHSIDAIAIGLWRWMVIRQLIVGIPVPISQAKASGKPKRGFRRARKLRKRAAQ
jgi:Holliday junction resolvasome RuvABC endonuclease subunit